MWLRRRSSCTQVGGPVRGVCSYPSPSPSRTAPPAGTCAGTCAGGQELLDENTGKDITQLFEGGSGHAHSRAAGLLLERYYAGDLAGAGGAPAPGSEEQRTLQAQAAAQDKLVDESRPLLSQVRVGRAGAPAALRGRAFQRWRRGVPSP
jgi:hypothetical protein